MDMIQTTIRLPAELKKQLQREADLKGYPLKDLILMIIDKYLHHQIGPRDSHK